MSQTKFGVNDPQEVKKWGTDLAVAVNREAYFASNMMSESKRARTPIQVRTELEKDAGLEVTVDLLMPMSMEPVVQEKLEGRGQALKYFTDKLRIDQVRGAASAGDRVTSKATLRNLREDAKTVMKDWWARLQDELFFIYLSGARGTGAGYLWSATNKMFNVNPITAPDSNHLMYGGNATAKTDVGTDDGFDLRLIDRAVARAETMGGDGTDELSMVPVNIEGKKCYVVLMHTFQYDAMKSNTATGQWLDIQKAAAAGAGGGQQSPLFRNAAGSYADCVIHKHRNVVRFSDYGGGAVPAARALFLASQAAVIAYGSAGGMGTRYRWTEVMTDHEDHVEIGTHCIMGVKKSTYKSKDGSVVRDFGVFAMDTYCATVT